MRKSEKSAKVSQPLADKLGWKETEMGETIGTFGAYKVVEYPLCFHVVNETTGGYWVEHNKEEAVHAAEMAAKEAGA